MKRLSRVLEQIMLNFLSFLSEGPLWVVYAQRFFGKPVALQGLSDALIALTYYAITLLLLYLGRRRPDLPFSGLLLGCVVMASCGTTHLAELWALWHPGSGLVEVSKLITAAIALTTTVWLLKRIPDLLALPDIPNITERKQVTEQLRSLSDRLQYLLSHAPVVIFSRKTEGCYGATWVSENVRTLFGYEPQDFLDNAEFWINQVHPDDRDRVLDNASQLLDVDHKVCEYRFLHPDGDYRWIYEQAQLMRDETGNPTEIIGYMINITARKSSDAERKQVEAALQESESRFHALVTNMPGMVYRYLPDTGAGGTFTYVSSGANALLELAPAQILQNANSVWGLIYPEDLPSLQRSVAIAVENHADWRWDGRLITPSGQLKWIQGNSRPQETPEGMVWDGLMMDITDRKLAEIALQESEERFREIANTIPQMFFVRSTNPDRYVYISPAYEKIWGRSQAELLQNPSIWMDAIHPDDRQHVQSSVASQMRGNTVRREYRIVRPDDTIRWVSAEVTAIFDASGDPLRFIGLAEDITERKVAELALAQETLRRKMLFDTSIDGIVVLDHSGHVIEANASFARMLGYTLDEITTLNLVDFDVYWTPKEFENKIGKFNVCSNEFETRHRRKDGSIYDVEISANPVDWDGQSVQFCICRDVSDRKQTEAALYQSEATNRAMLAAIPDLLLRLNRDGTCLNFIPPTSTKAGLFLPIQQNVSEIMPPELVQYQLQRMEQALETGELQVWEHQFLKNGKLCGEEVRVSPCGANEVLVIVRDISEQQAALRERQQAEEALQRYERIVSATTDAILLIDCHYVYQIVNQAYLNWHNKQQDEIVGHPVSEMVPQSLFQTTIKPHLDQCLAGQASQFETWVNYPAMGPQYVSCTLDPYFDMNQSLSGAVVSIRNITRLKQAEMELELQSVIVKNMAEGVCMIKAADSTLVYTNPKFEQLFGYEAGELKGKHTSILNYGSENANPRVVHQEIIEAVLQHGETTYVVHNVKKDGTLFWSRGTASIFQHPEYETVMVAVQQDITEQKQAEEQIKASLKEKDVLLKEIHHRVKNNLGVIDGLLKMQARRSLNPEVVEALQESQNRVASIALVHEKLYSSEHLAEVDFAQYINDLTAHLFDCYNIYAKQVRLTVEIDEIPLDIDTAIPCGLIINELVSNALKYAFSNTQTGEIRVTFGQNPDQSLFLTVQDNGMGLPPDFDHKQTQTLGISLIKGLVKQLKGTLDLRTQSGTIALISFKRA